MKKTVAAFALVAFFLAPATSRPAAAPAAGPFEGEIFYDLVYTSYENTIHLRYTIKGTKVRIDWVDVDEKDPSRTHVLKVKESSFVDWSGQPAGWIEEREDNIHLDRASPSEPYIPFPGQAQLPGQRRNDAETDYEENYHYAIQKAELAPGAGPSLTAPSKEIDVELWRAGDAAPLTVASSPLSVVSLQSFPSLKDSPFPLVAHARMKKGAGMSMGDPNHLSYWMYAVKIIPAPVQDGVFQQGIKGLAAPPSGLSELAGDISRNGLFNKVVTVTGPVTAK